MKPLEGFQPIDSQKGSWLQTLNERVNAAPCWEHLHTSSENQKRNISMAFVSSNNKTWRFLQEEFVRMLFPTVGPWHHSDLGGYFLHKTKQILYPKCSFNLSHWDVILFVTSGNSYQRIQIFRNTMTSQQSFFYLFYTWLFFKKVFDHVLCCLSIK